MRDLHVIHWLSKLRGLRQFGRAIAAGRLAIFWRPSGAVCITSAGRDSNVLTFDLQEELAAEPASWMRDYFRHARDIYRCAKQQMEISDNAAEGGLTASSVSGVPVFRMLTSPFPRTRFSACAATDRERSIAGAAAIRIRRAARDPLVA